MLQFTLIGNLGSDAQVRAENGRQFVSFSVAHTDRYTDADGKEHESTQWVSCALNGDGGKLLQYLTKGRMVFVQGRGRTRVYSSPKERKMVAGLNISVDRIELVGGQADNFPRHLADDSGALHDVYTAHYLTQESMKQLQVPAGQVRMMYSEKGQSFNLDSNGFLWPIQSDQTADGGNADAAGEQPAGSEEQPEIY